MANKKVTCWSPHFLQHLNASWSCTGSIKYPCTLVIAVTSGGRCSPSAPPPCSTYTFASFSLSLPPQKRSAAWSDSSRLLRASSFCSGCSPLLSWRGDMAISISFQCLGLIVLGAILLQTVAVAVSFMYFNKVLHTVRSSNLTEWVQSLLNHHALHSDTSGFLLQAAWSFPEVTVIVHLRSSDNRTP